MSISETNNEIGQTVAAGVGATVGAGAGAAFGVTTVAAAAVLQQVGLAWLEVSVLSQLQQQHPQRYQSLAGPSAEPFLPAQALGECTS